MLLLPATIYGAIHHPPTTLLDHAALLLGAVLGLAVGLRLLHAAITGRVPAWLKRGMDDYW